LVFTDQALRHDDELRKQVITVELGKYFIEMRVSILATLNMGGSRELSS